MSKREIAQEMIKLGKLDFVDQVISAANEPFSSLLQFMKAQAVL